MNLIKRDSIWNVVQTHYHKEGIAVSNLEQRVFVSFWSSSRRQVRHARTASEVLAPLSPGYLHGSLDLATDRWRIVNSTLDVKTLVRDSDASLSTLPFKVLRGSVADRLAKGAKWDDRSRVSVLFELLGRQDRVAMDL